MPTSESPDVPETVQAEPGIPAVDRLEAAVERLLAEARAWRERAAESEAAYEKLRRALETADRESADAADVEERLERLAEENRRLRETLEGARERAERIRSRLMVVEDEL